MTMFSTIAATISTSSSGFVFETLGHLATFLMLAGMAAAKPSMTWFLLPESKPAEYLD